MFCNRTRVYSYGFNGKENDGAAASASSVGEGTQDYGMRIYNPSLGKFLSVDPLQKEYPELTPYQFASNSPIVGIDRDGLEIAHYSLTYSNGKPELKMLGVQIRRPSFRQEVIDLFGTMDYNLFEYDGDIIKGLSFQVYYQGAVIPLNTVDDLAKFASAGEENADAAALAYFTQQALIGHAIGEMKAMEESGHQAFEDCYIYKPVNVPKQNIDVIDKQQKSSNNGVNSNGEKTSTIKKDGASRAAIYSTQWKSSSLNAAVNKFAPNSKGTLIGDKMIYLNQKTGMQVVYDTKGNYFRIQNTNVTGRRNYTDLTGKIENNKTLNGKESGKSQAEYNADTHYNNTDTPQ